MIGDKNKFLLFAFSSALMAPMSAPDIEYIGATGVTMMMTMNMTILLMEYSVIEKHKLEENVLLNNFII